MLLIILILAVLVIVFFLFCIMKSSKQRDIAQEQACRMERLKRGNRWFIRRVK